MSITKKLIGNEEERAVSPVIGVILMVAITVILAAVIAAFVLDLGGSISEEAQAGVNMEIDSSNDNNITATWTSQGNAERIEVRNTAGDSTNISSVGDSVSIAHDNDTVTAIAVTDSGVETVVQTESP